MNRATKNSRVYRTLYNLMMHLDRSAELKEPASHPLPPCNPSLLVNPNTLPLLNALEWGMQWTYEKWAPCKIHGDAICNSQVASHQQRPKSVRNCDSFFHHRSQLQVLCEFFLFPICHSVSLLFAQLTLDSYFFVCGSVTDRQRDDPSTGSFSTRSQQPEQGWIWPESGPVWTQEPGASSSSPTQVQKRR